MQKTPYHSINIVETDNISETNEEIEIIKAHSLSKSIQLFSLLDFLFCFINLLYYYPPSSIVSLCVLMGYAGAYYYNDFLITMYMSYMFLYIATRIYLFFIESYNNPYYYILISSIIISLWLLILLCKFSILISKMNDTKIQYLIYFSPDNYHYTLL